MDVAREAGVSYSTVSRVVNKYEFVKPATRQKVEAAMAQLGYVANIKARSLAGFKAALTDAGLSIDPDLFLEGDFLKQLGYENTRKLLALPNPPTGILASSDLAAFGAMRAIQEANLRIPHDVSVIGFDDVPEASYMLPLLTTVRQPLQKMGRLATQMLIESIDDPERPPRQIKLPTKLIIRESTAPPPV